MSPKIRKNYGTIRLEETKAARQPNAMWNTRLGPGTEKEHQCKNWGNIIHLVTNTAPMLIS